MFMEEAVQVKGIKLQDVAKQAGVSPATVTRVLHANGYVSEEKRALVEKAMQERLEGKQVNVAVMKKNRKFQKDQLAEEGWTEIVEIFE